MVANRATQVKGASKHTMAFPQKRNPTVIGIACVGTPLLAA